MITTTRMSYYQQPEVALILLLMRHLQEHKGCVCCRGVWMDDSCTDQHLVRSGTGRAGPSQAEPSQVRFLSKKLISQADCWRASQKQSHRHREEEMQGLAAQTAVSASCRLQTSLQPHHAQTTWWSRTRAVHPAGGATGQRRSQACWVHPLESRNTEASSIQTMCLFCFVHVHVQTFRVLSLIFFIFIRYQT